MNTRGNYSVLQRCLLYIPRTIAVRRSRTRLSSTLLCRRISLTTRKTFSLATASALSGISDEVSSRGV